MPLILNIDTATEVASVCISYNQNSLAYRQNEQQREHASFVHAAIADALKEAGVNLKDVDAFAVTAGPGSYTGLRVAMATAKGFCYAFSKPLIAINTMEVMAYAAAQTLYLEDNNVLLCPMINARRMEVFMTLYSQDLRILLSTRAIILSEFNFNNYLEENKIVFFGNGSTKFSQVISHTNAIFKTVDFNSHHLGSLANKAFQQKKFANVSYSEPNYFKEFYSVLKV